MPARNELKHALNYTDYVTLQSRIKVLMKQDENTPPSGEYTVRSLYFDTANDKALREKIDGVNRREKFRLRCYNYDYSFISLEKKSKIDGVCFKSSVRVTRGEVQALLRGDYGWMLDETRGLLSELYVKIKSEGLRPKTLVDYKRQAFYHPAGNVRVTFDRDIRTGLFAQDFLNPTLPMIPAGDTAVLLEVKFDKFIPDYITAALQLGARPAVAFSKYATCRIYG